MPPLHWQVKDRLKRRLLVALGSGHAGRFTRSLFHAMDVSLASKQQDRMNSRPDATRQRAMGPWLRPREEDTLLLARQTVHMNLDCLLITGHAFPLSACYCVDKLHRCLFCSVALVHKPGGEANYFVSQSLPFGACSSVYAFNRISASIRFLVQKVLGGILTVIL